MALSDIWARLFRKHGDVRSFERDVAARGGVVGMVDRGYKEVPVERIVGSVSRWQNLRSDFFYKSGKVTGRFQRIGQAMRQGKGLPPLELYKVKPKDEPSQYYVVDGHHRVAMAKQVGQGEMEAHVVEHRVPAEPGQEPRPEEPTTGEPKKE